MIVVAYEPAHVALIRPQAAQAHEMREAEIPPAHAGPAWTAFHGNDCLAVAGLVEMGSHRAYAWALLSEHAREHLLALTRQIGFRLDSAPFARIEMAVDRDFAAGCRWAQLFGFEMECLARKYLPGPRDAWIYAKVK